MIGELGQLSLCFALATGVGKTRLMGAFIAYAGLALFVGRHHLEEVRPQIFALLHRLREHFDLASVHLDLVGEDGGLSAVDDVRLNVTCHILMRTF